MAAWESSLAWAASPFWFRHDLRINLEPAVRIESQPYGKQAGCNIFALPSFAHANSRSLKAIMKPSERQQSPADHLDSVGVCSYNDLARLLNVSKI